MVSARAQSPGTTAQRGAARVGGGTAGRCGQARHDKWYTRPKGSFNVVNVSPACGAVVGSSSAGALRLQRAAVAVFQPARRSAAVARAMVRARW